MAAYGGPNIGDPRPEPAGGRPERSRLRALRHPGDDPRSAVWLLLFAALGSIERMAKLVPNIGKNNK